MMILKNIISISLLAGAACLITSCSTVKPTPTMAFQVHSAQYLNPNVEGQASPIVLSIYQLSSKYKFQRASYYALSENSGKALQNDLIDKSTLEVRPGKDFSYNQPLSANTRYLGIVAAYRNIDNSSWQAVIPVNPDTIADTLVSVDLESQSLHVSTSTEKDSFLW